MVETATAIFIKPCGLSCNTGVSSMWSKYDYVCSDCDALIEITTLDKIPDCFEPECPCGSANVIWIGMYDGNAPVIKVTPSNLVKINSNPYN
jgi:hypothetical protein